MNVLLIGGSCSLIDQLIIKYKKEGNRLFLLTGDKYKKHKYEKVFEKYDFSYDTENLDEIFESVNPDITVILGAFDTNYNWKDIAQESVHFISHLMNILVSFTGIKNNRIFFLSSNTIFEGYHADCIAEDKNFVTRNPISNCLKQAEQICQSFKENYNLDIYTLRLEGVFGLPKSKEDMTNICAKMVRQALKDHVIRANINHEFTLMRAYNTSKCIFLISTVHQLRYYTYHISTSHILNEVELAGYINKALSQKVNVVTTTNEKEKYILSSQRIHDEFGIVVSDTIEEDVKEVVEHIEKNKEELVFGGKHELTLTEKIIGKTQWFIKIIIPFIENCICFIPFFMLNNRTVGSQYFANLDPYLLYVLLFAIIYGQQQATFSAVLAVGGYLFRQMYTRSGFQVVLDYNTYVWIAQLFILGLVVGYMRDQIKLIKSESQEMEEHLSHQIVDIRDINGSNVRIKNVLEKQVVDQKDSLGTIYSITSKLDQTMPQQVVFDAVEMMKDLMDIDDIAIYSIVNSDYARMFSASSQKARSLGNSIRYKELEDMYASLKQEKVYINRSMDNHYPMMANAIFENEHMQMIIMVWGLTWERMTLAQSNYLVVITYLIQHAILRANRYMQALVEKRYVENSNILEPEAFLSLVKAYESAASRDLVVCTLLKIHVKEKKYNKFEKDMSKKLRNQDYLGILKDYGLCVLLANTSKEDAKFVMDRLQASGYDSDIIQEEIK